MSDRPQWMIRFAEELIRRGSTETLTSVTGILDRHYSPEAERVKELRRTTRVLVDVIEKEAGKRSGGCYEVVEGGPLANVRKALEAWEK